MVIIGLQNILKGSKSIFTEGNKFKVENISPTLSGTKDFSVTKHTTSICNLPEMRRGNMPNDKEFLRISKSEKDELLLKFPAAKKIIRRQIGSAEFINDIERYCYWISDENLNLANSIPPIKEAIENCRNYRLNSEDKTLDRKSVV